MSTDHESHHTELHPRIGTVVLQRTDLGDVLILRADEIVAVSRPLLADIGNHPNPHARIEGDGSLLVLTGQRLEVGTLTLTTTTWTYRDTGRTYDDPDRSPLFELIDRTP